MYIYIYIFQNLFSFATALLLQISLQTFANSYLLCTVYSMYIYIFILTHAALSGIAVSLTRAVPLSGQLDLSMSWTRGQLSERNSWLFWTVLTLIQNSSCAQDYFKIPDSLLFYEFAKKFANLNPHIFFNYWPSWVVGPWILLEEQMLWRSAVPDNVQIDSALSCTVFSLI